ncbi:MAG TPA: IS3 family transposase [Bryobacteraceae bacterium]|nr:IS3 family transposase [Bryobacteraceae bacterium]
MRHCRRDGIYDQIRELMSMQGSLSIERMSQLAGVSRAGFYRSLQAQQPVEEDMEVRSAIQNIFAEHKRRYGYRRVSKELRRRGMLVNHKRVLRLMREDHLLAVQPRAFVVTTDSAHDFEVYLNLASRMKLTGVNQLWVADITYIRLHREWVFLAVILDSFSRKVVGWELDRTLAARLPMTALEKAIAERKPPPGVVHHSDRGVQYASDAYVGLLRKHGMVPSMSRPANPYDNASCESFMKTLKREEIHVNEYRDLDHLRANIVEFIDNYYNRVRLHSALGYKPPEEFEQGSNAATRLLGASMSFFRHQEIYRSDAGSTTEREPAEAGSPDHRLDESPAGYSLASCSPAELASASPAEDHCGGDDTV